MRIAVIGAGAVGSYLGARFATAGHAVQLLARGTRLGELREHGVTVRSPLGNVEGLRVPVTDDPHGIGPADAVLVAVRSFDLDSALHTVQLLVDDDTAVLSLQVGVEAAARIAAALGHAPVLAGVIELGAARGPGGAVTHRQRVARLAFGELDGRRTPRAEELLVAGARAGLDVSLVDDIESLIWQRWCAVCACGGVTALTRLPLARVLAEPEAVVLFLRMLEECECLAEASGVPIPQGLPARLLHAARAGRALEPGPALLAELEAGRPLELEALHGSAGRLGRALGVATPVNDLVYAALKPHAGGRLPPAARPA